MELRPTEQSLLIEDIGLVIEERADLSPLASRIYATLILASDDGLTFEDITEAHRASKSSVSNNLNILVKLKYAEYYTKSGQRKRFFKASKYYAKTAMEKYNELFKKEIEVLEKINSFNKKNNPEKFKNEQSVSTIYQDYLIQLKEGFKKKIKQLETIVNQ
ncbi:hypothetical protein IMCC3317_47020 [Kordia antarctica]|uniref:Transcriptional regulator n=1 Tax=Kordia antarctica TaxID=1218801 RepID=A0A7L4ZRP3_9FLAO|nr:hypothetical protein [Kordia antarctica]QHI39292.1 hypothetical protein IMCC3317_47020 [Kordia antarctica]